MTRSRFSLLARALVAALTATACAGDVMAPDLISTPAHVAASRDDGYRVVHVRSGPGAESSTDAGAPVVDNFVDALARVATGGTIRVHDGTYDVTNVTIGKPVTIHPNGAANPVIRTGHPNGFRVFTDLPGTVTIRGLTFEVQGLRAILAAPRYDQVIIEDSRFNSVAGGPTPSGLPIGFVSAGAATSNARPTAKFIARRNVFAGGHWALISTGAAAEFIDNSVSNMGTGGIQFENGARGLMQGNTVERCGVRRCIGVAASRGVVVRDNTVRNEHPRAVRAGIQLFNGGDVVAEGNQVLGSGGFGRNPADHAFEFGIDVSGGNPPFAMTASVTGNRVSGANQGIALGGVKNGQVAGNTVEPCGAWSCITVHGSAVQGANVVVRGNVLRSVLARRTFFAVQSGWSAGSGALSVVENDIAGAAAPADPAAPSTYALDIAFQNGTWYPPGLEGVPLGASVDFSRNRVSNAAVGVRAFHGGRIHGRDNIFSTIHGEVFGAHDRGVNALQFNDVGGYRFALSISGSPLKDVEHRGTLDVRCNYWGGGAPVGTGIAPASAYSPFSARPIAGTGATGCSP
jgi:hypothetical protein